MALWEGGVHSAAQVCTGGRWLLAAMFITPSSSVHCSSASSGILVSSVGHLFDVCFTGHGAMSHGLLTLGRLSSSLEFLKSPW